MQNSETVKKIYSLRKNIIIGLTGRTGSGCTTISKLLSTEQFTQLNLVPYEIDSEKYSYDETVERLKKNKIHDYISYGENWKPFTVIDMSSIIFSFIMEGGAKKLINYIKGISKKKSYSHQIEIKDIDVLEKYIIKSASYFEAIKKFKLSDYKNTEECPRKKFIEFYCRELLKYSDSFKNELKKYKVVEITQSKFEEKKSTIYNLYPYIMQKFGNNLRRSADYTDDLSNKCSYALLERVNKLIEIIFDESNSAKVPARICIDSLKNPFEINFLKDRYANFYVFSVNVEEESRKIRLALVKEELENLDKVEYPSHFNSDDEIFYHQDIQSCIETADIHLYNPDDKINNYKNIKEQLIKYIALIMHPGLVTPTNMEKCMQIAYNAKMNSGCLSRQVGAVITDRDYSVKAIGWNDVPQFQVSCNLRDISSFCKKKNSKLFSDYEKFNDDFDCALKTIDDKLKNTDLLGLNCNYCFKDIYNGIEKNKNQVHTRSLHAEENAFLQLSKYGGMGIKNGKLFVTASPCELCSKKSYQLGIREIYYIDPYPGIARGHILNCGFKKPNVHLFYGAIGSAYILLYKPKFAMKDELRYITGLDQKEAVYKRNSLEISPLKYADLIYEKVSFEMQFLSATNIKASSTLSFVPQIKGIKKIEKLNVWTGGSEINPQIVSSTVNCHIGELERKNVLTKYCIEFDSELKQKELVELKTEIQAEDLNRSMMPYISHRVRNKINELEIILSLPRDDEYFNKCKVYKTVYADFKMEQQVEKSPLECDKNTGKYVYNIKTPNLNYSYCIEWDI